jgi:hypothetical protein
MILQTEWHLRPSRLAICLAMASVLLSGGLPVARASGEKGVGGGAGAASIKAPHAKRTRQSLDGKRAMTKAVAGKRDPFKAPPPPRLDGKGGVVDGPLPAGARGLVIGQLSLKGIVREDASNTMIAVVTNRSNLAYFLRVHEDVYNGVVSRITPDAIYFQQKRLDASGRVEVQDVILKLAERSEAR